MMVNRFPETVRKTSRVTQKQDNAAAQANGRSTAEPPAAAAGDSGLGTAKKTSRTKTTARKPASRSKRSASKHIAEPSEDEIRLRAYFIAESRSHLRKPGDETTDWLEAKRQLFAEAGIPLP